MKKYNPVRFELRPSLLCKKQVGLFALMSFKKDEIIVSKDFWDETRFISWQEFNQLDSQTQNKLVHFCFKDDKGIYAPQDINKIGIVYFFNHSCSPNSYCDSEGNYRAIKNIKRNQEFSLDVESIMDKTVVSFKCSCGQKNCRKIIKI